MSSSVKLFTDRHDEAVKIIGRTGYSIMKLIGNICI